MKPEIEYIKELAKILTSNGLSEISLENGEQAITLRKDLQEVATVANPASQAVQPAVQEVKLQNSNSTPNMGNAIVSPMVGTFYVSASSDDEAFAEVGTEIKAGDVVCIIEAMKLMNEIKSDYSGKIKQICVKNGEPVEYGQVLMYIE